MSVTDWLYQSQKNKPQGNSLAGGIFVFFAAGLQIGWIYNNQLQHFKWAQNHSSFQVIITYVGFYVLAIAGLYMAAMVIDRLTKRNIYVSLKVIRIQFGKNFMEIYFQFSALTLSFLGSACFIAMPKSLYLNVAARLLIGFSFGYSYLVCIVHASEIMTQKLRGMIVATFNFIVLSSILINETFVIATDHEVHALGTMQWIGIYGAIFGVLGIALLPMLTHESPVLLIRRNKDSDALSLMIKVRNENSETYEIRNEFNELKTMVEEDKQFSPKIFLDGNERALIMVALLRLGNVLSFNFGLNMIRMANVSQFDGEDNVNFGGTLLMTVRMMAALFTLFTFDTKGRRPYFLISFGGTSFALIIFGFLIYFYNNPIIIAIVQVIIEIFGGIGIGSVADVYSSEAFGTMKKAYSIFVTIAIEFGLQALIIALTFGTELTRTFSAVYPIVSGGVLLLITYYLKEKLPETAKMSIRQTRNEFLKSGEIVFSGGNKSSPSTITFH